MKGYIVLVLFYACVAVFADSSLGVPGGLSEDEKKNIDSILNIFSCLDDPLCLPHMPVVTPVSPAEKAIRIRIENYDPTISQEEYLAIFQQQMAQGQVIKGTDDKVDKPLDTSMPKPPSPYSTVCERVYMKLEELELEYPELKEVNQALIGSFNEFLKQFKGSVKKGENVVDKFLDMCPAVVDDLKKYLIKEPCQKPVVVEEPWNEVEEIIAEEGEAPYIGSVRGLPGVHYPNYTEVPITSFNCNGKEIPGFYADLETGCQVFHVCYEHRRESFLCPLGTIFNQPILACDYWYSSNCSLAPNYFEKPEKPLVSTTEGPVTEEPIKVIEEEITKEEEVTSLVPFIPVEAKIVDYPKKPEGKPVVSIITGVEAIASKIFGEVIAKKLAEAKGKVPVKTPVEQVADKVFEGVVTTGLKVASKAREVVGLLPKPGLGKMIKPHPVAKTAAIKAKFAAKAAAVPIAKSVLAAAKLPIIKAEAAAVAAKVPIIKAKVAATAVKVPIVKAKVAATAVKVPIVKAAVKVPVVKAKVAAVPIAKAKVFKAAAVPFFKVKAAAKPLAKVKLVEAAVPAIKAKKFVKMAPIVKIAALPVVKAKVAGSAAIAPLTKKALALGYLKLLKAKKFVLMG